MSENTQHFYGKAVATLKREKVPFMIGGAFALRHYTGITRDTKDLDIFLRGEDVAPAMRALTLEGFRTELTDALWLAKAFDNHEEKAFIDLIFSSGNGLCPVDDIWFTQSTTGTFGGQIVRMTPPEEMIYSKAFIMARDRYDGADIAHLFLVLGKNLDWDRMLWRFGANWRVLLSHLLLFPFIYPGESDRVPPEIMERLLARAARENAPDESSTRICRGSLLDRVGYQVDAEAWGYGSRRIAQVV